MSIKNECVNLYLYIVLHLMSRNFRQTKCDDRQNKRRVVSRTYGNLL